MSFLKISLTVPCNLNETGIFYFIQYTSKTDVQVCVKNYNSDANNKDVITVDYIVTGGKRKRFNLQR